MSKDLNCKITILWASYLIVFWEENEVSPAYELNNIEHFPNLFFSYFIMNMNSTHYCHSKCLSFKIFSNQNIPEVVFECICLH